MPYMYRSQKFCLMMSQLFIMEPEEPSWQWASAVGEAAIKEYEARPPPCRPGRRALRSRSLR